MICIISLQNHFCVKFKKINDLNLVSAPICFKIFVLQQSIHFGRFDIFLKYYLFWIPLQQVKQDSSWRRSHVDKKCLWAYWRAAQLHVFEPNMTFYRYKHIVNNNRRLRGGCWNAFPALHGTISNQWATVSHLNVVVDQVTCTKLYIKKQCSFA